MAAPTSPLSRAALVLALYLGLGAAGVVWSVLRGHPNVWRLAGHADPRPLWGIVLGISVGGLLVLASRLSVHRFEWARALHRDFRARLGPLPESEVLILASASSLGEEVFFRGALQPVIGLWPASLVFTLLHIGPKISYLPWTISALLAGVLFGQLFEWSGDLSGPVLAHFIVNFLNFRHLRDYDLR